VHSCHSYALHTTSWQYADFGCQTTLDQVVAYLRRPRRRHRHSAQIAPEPPNRVYSERTAYRRTMRRQAMSHFLIYGVFENKRIDSDRSA
jgi:hypothetical protein